MRIGLHALLAPLVTALSVVACGTSSGPVLVDVTGTQDSTVAVDALGDSLVVDPDVTVPPDSLDPKEVVEPADLEETPDLPPDVCAPDCADKECGDDGCGGDCGTCPGAAPLCVDGLCEIECIADCEGLECGDDGCGGDCGTCPAIAPICEAGFCQFACDPDCAGKDCGTDGCEGSCGECAEGVFCNDGACEELCVSDEGCSEVGLTECTESGELRICEEVTPDCLKWDEPAGCDDGYLCEEGECIEICVPDCEGLECGEDGCGGNCGDCEDGSYCQEGICQEECVSDEGCTEDGLAETLMTAN